MIAEADVRAPAAPYRAAPIRGTQSFVGVMTAVWRRPLLVAVEVLWRWAAGIPLLAVCAWEFLRLRGSVALDFNALEAMTVFKPVQAGMTLSTAVHAVVPVVLPVLLWLVPAALLLRTVCAAFGRATLLRRLEVDARPQRRVTFALSAVRTVALLLALAAWAFGVRWADTVAITNPAASGQEPNVVLLCGLVVFGTLGLFVAWALSIWVIDIAFVLSSRARAGAIASVRDGLHRGALRSKLIEVDLVMGIVKVALIVLAMVFSACPLPFAQVESQSFLTWWWIGVGVLYVLASDYFHVVRMAACVTLARAYEPPSDQETGR